MASDQGSIPRRARVLIAEREAPMADALAANLRQRLVEVDLAASAAEVVALLTRSSYSVAVMDLSLLESPSGEIIAQLAAVPRAARPIVLATTSAGPRVDLDAEVVQVVIRKPIRTGELAEMIQACIENESVARGAAIDRNRPRLDLHRD